MTRLLASLDAPPSGRQRATWFDAAGYGQARLLAGGPLPWPSPAELTAFFGKLGRGMFRPDAVLVDIGDVFAQRAAGDGQLRAAMAARTRPGYALRTLLADEQARAVAAEAVRALAATAGVSLILTAPTPGRWLTAAAAQAGAEPGPVDADRAGTAAMYVADMLRTFGGLGVDGLLVDEGPVPAAELIDPEASRSVLNVAEHYEWPVLFRADAAAAWPHGSVPGVAVWIGSTPPTAPSGRWGVVAGPEFWDGEEPDPDAAPVLVTVPAQADPEAVMKRVRALG